MNSINTIKNQKIKQVLEKACILSKKYNKASGCQVTVLDSNYNVIEHSPNSTLLLFCTICEECRGKQCRMEHINAIQDSCRYGGMKIYTCEMGLVFWASPFFCGIQFAGAFIGSGSLGVTAQQAADKIQQISNGKM